MFRLTMFLSAICIDELILFSRGWSLLNIMVGVLLAFDNFF